MQQTHVFGGVHKHTLIYNHIYSMYKWYIYVTFPRPFLSMRGRPKTIILTLLTATPVSWFTLSRLHITISQDGYILSDFLALHGLQLAYRTRLLSRSRQTLALRQPDRTFSTLISTWVHHGGHAHKTRLGPSSQSDSSIS